MVLRRIWAAQDAIHWMLPKGYAILESPGTDQLYVMSMTPLTKLFQHTETEMQVL